MGHSYDIVGYIYKADIYCPRCVIEEVEKDYPEALRGQTLYASMSFEEMLQKFANGLRIDYSDPYSYDSDNFPKVIFRDQLEDDERCATCHDELSE